MSLETEVQALATASNAQTAASQALSQEVAGKMPEIDAKVDSAINETKASLTIITTNTLRKQVEAVSGGRNTVIVDEQGNENVMVVIPRFNIEDLGLAALNLGAGTHPAFITNGAPKGEILVGKYLASAGTNGGCSVIGGVQPRTSVNYDAAKALCVNKGANWHMMSIHEWAAISLWALANNTEPRGNTNYGRSHESYLETARRHDNGMPGDTSGTGRTDTGKGPATWGHDHTQFGVQDLTGNVWEWLDQMMLENGRIITTLDNNPELAEASWFNHAAYLDSLSAGTSGQVGSQVLNSAIVNRNGALGDDNNSGAYNYNASFSAITKDLSYVPNELLRQLLIESESTATVKGGLWSRNYGTRFPIRGGIWGYGSTAGLGALNLSYSRSLSGSSIGFRPAFSV